mgnify:CR=1 FL=1
MSRFSRESFNEQIKTILNNPEYKVEVVKVAKSKAEGYDVSEVAVTEGFRKFCKRLLEQFGVDKYESEKVMTKDFQFNNVDGLYEFMCAAIYDYIDNGNKFDFVPRMGFKGSLELVDVEEKTKTSKLRDKVSGEERIYTTFMKKHKKLKASSSCPSYLKVKKDLE